MKAKSCSFTGHRRIKVTQKLTDKLSAVIEKLIQNGVTDFYSGGAVGFDMLCEGTVLALREKYPDIRLNLVLPCSFKEQAKNWSDHDKVTFCEIFCAVDNVEYTSREYSKECMKIRNARLVELADCLVCFYLGKYISGTGQTVRMAEKKGIDIYNVAKK